MEQNSFSGTDGRLCEVCSRLKIVRISWQTDRISEIYSSFYLSGINNSIRILNKKLRLIKVTLLLCV